MKAKYLVISLLSLFAGVSFGQGDVVPSLPIDNSIHNTNISVGENTPNNRYNALRYRARSQGLDEANTVPYFTIPDTSLLANSVATTALAGKIYLNSDIVNPRLFKVRVGRDNLTSNGVRLPREIEGMVLEGFAVGEYNTSCVRGILTAGTFVFEDGTVRSIYPGDAGSRRSASLDRIGYISDRWGNDCLPGQLISDGVQYLGQSFALAGLVGYSEALKAAQTNTIKTTQADGTVREENQITGNRDRYASAAAIAGGIDSTVDWLEERHKATTDLVYLPAGQRVDIHVQQELRIDIPTNARKVRYKRTSHVTKDLD